MVPQSLGVPESVCPTVVALVSFIPSGSASLTASSVAGFPETCWEGFDGDIPFRTEFSKVSCSLHGLAVRLCVCSHRLQKEASQMQAE